LAVFFRPHQSLRLSHSREDLPNQGAARARISRQKPQEFLVMPGKQAKAITPQMLRRMLIKASKSPFRARDRAMILLSVKAGLRACEIARLDWSMVLDARGKVADVLAIHDAIAKKRGGRRIPMHHDLRHALQALRRVGNCSGPVIRSARGGYLRPQAWSTGLRRCFGTSASKDARRTPAGAPSSPGPRVTSTAAAAASATCSCSLGTDRSKRQSGISTATRRDKGAWSACCDPRPTSNFHLKG
jgi:integrase